MDSGMFQLFFVFTVILFFLAFFYKSDRDLQIIFAILGFVMATISTYSSLLIEDYYIVNNSLEITSRSDYAFFGVCFILSITLLFQSMLLLWTRAAMSTSVDSDLLGIDKA